MEVLTLQTRVYFPDGSINITTTSILPQMVVLTLQTRVYYPGGSINITNTGILPRCKYSYYKHEYIYPRWKY